MIKPMVMTAEGDTLEVKHNDQLTEDSPMTVSHQEIARHIHCWGRVFLIAISRSDHAILCNKCCLRVPVRIAPKEDTRPTYQELGKAVEVHN